MNYLAVSVAIGLLMISPQAVGAARLQPAGGANQADAVEGALNQTLFNGEVRLRASSLRAATDAERDDVSPPDGQKVLVLTCAMSNGTHSTFNGVFEIRARRCRRRRCCCCCCCRITLHRAESPAGRTAWRRLARKRIVYRAGKLRSG
jgi:hypothetical protein